MESGRCVASTTCPSGQYQYKSNCVSSCPVGTYMSGNTCVRSCTDSKNYFFNQICFPSCPTALRTADACVNNCPSGTTAVNGVCQWSIHPFIIIILSYHSYSYYHFIQYSNSVKKKRLYDKPVNIKHKRPGWQTRYPPSAVGSASSWSPSAWQKRLNKEKLTCCCLSKKKYVASACYHDTDTGNDLYKYSRY